MDPAASSEPSARLRRARHDGECLEEAHRRSASSSLPSGSAAANEGGAIPSKRPSEDSNAAGNSEREADGEDFAWEMSKENVMPLTRGRKIETIKRAFGGSAAAHGRRGPAEVLATLKSKFEPLIEEAGDGNVDELLELAGEQPSGAGAADPLALWWGYIQAVQDSLPADQQEQFELLERCSRRFKDVPRYKQDLRYLRVWIAYASHLSNADDLFKFLYKKGIGSTLAHFWIGWALHAETAGKYPLVEKLYVKGIDRRAQPMELILKRQREFLRRMRRQWINSQEEEGVQAAVEMPEDEESRRGILQTLSAAAVARNQRNRAASGAGNSHTDENDNRGVVTGASGRTNDHNGQQSRRQSRRTGGDERRGLRSGDGGGRDVRGNAGYGSNGGPGFAVFVEDELEAGGLARSRRAAGGLLEEPQDEDGSSAVWADYGTRQSRNKENDSQPARWTDSALGDRSGSSSTIVAMPGSRRGASGLSAAPFPVFVDEKPKASSHDENDQGSHRPPLAASRGSYVGLSVRKRLDPSGGKSDAELLVTDPLLFMKNQKAAEAAEKRRLRSRSRSEVPADGQDASGEEEQIEEARAKHYFSTQRATKGPTIGSSTRSDDGRRVAPEPERISVDKRKRELDIDKRASVEGDGVEGFRDVVGGRNSGSGRSSSQDGRFASHGEENVAGIHRTELVWDRRNSGQSETNRRSGGLGAVSRGVEGSTNGRHKGFDVDSDVRGGDVRRDVPGLYGGPSEESIINTSSGVGLGVSGSSSFVEGKATGGHNASASFVNPRDAFGMEGEGDAEAGNASQRRLMFDNGEKIDNRRGTASQVAADNESGSTAESSDGQVVNLKKDEDMTIHTRMANQLLDEWMCGSEDDQNASLQDGGNPAQISSASDHVHAEDKGGEDFEIFYDPGGFLGEAALREREVRNAAMGNENSNRERELNAGIDDSVGFVEDEDRENLGCPKNPYARNVLDPGVEENVFRELEIPIPPDMVDDDDDEDGDDDDASSSTNSGSGSSNGHQGKQQRQISREISTMRATASASATAAATAAARRHDGGLPSSVEGVSERVSGLRQRGSESVLGSRGNGDGRRRGLLVPLEEGIRRRSRVTNGDIIRQFREASTADSGSSFASHAHPSVSRSVLASARERGGNNTAGAALQSMRETSEREDYDASHAAMSSAGSTETAVTSSSSNLGFAVFRDENDEPEVADSPSKGVTSSSSSLGFAVFRDVEGDEGDPEVADAPLVEGSTQAALGFSVAQDAVYEDVVDDDMDHQPRGATANVASDSHRRFSRDFGRLRTDDEPGKASGGPCSLRPSMEDVAQPELTYFEDDEGVEGLSTLSFFDDSPVNSSRAASVGFAGRVNSSPASRDGASAAALNLRRKSNGPMHLELSCIPEADTTFEAQDGNKRLPLSVSRRYSDASGGLSSGLASSTVPCSTGEGFGAETPGEAFTPMAVSESDTNGCDWLGTGASSGLQQPSEVWGGCSTIKRMEETREKRRVSKGIRGYSGGIPRGVGSMTDCTESPRVDMENLGPVRSGRSLGTATATSIGSGPDSRVGNFGAGDERKMSGGRASYHSLCFSSSSSSSSSSPFPLLDGDKPYSNTKG